MWEKMKNLGKQNQNQPWKISKKSRAMIYLGKNPGNWNVNYNQINLEKGKM